MEKERTLSKRETERKLLFDAKAAQLTAEGYTQEPLTMGIVKANILSLFLPLPFIALMALLWMRSGQELYFAFEVILLCPLLIVLTVLHELIHGFVWGLFCKSHWKDIEFGIIWKMLTPYCTCGGALTKAQYIAGSFMPTLVLGLGLGVLSVFIGNVLLFLAAEIMILGGGGDLIVIAKLLLFPTKGRTCLFFDHPTELGLVVFYK